MTFASASLIDSNPNTRDFLQILVGITLVPLVLFSARIRPEGPWSLDIFLCEFQAPDGQTENSPGLQPWERHAQGNRPERASEWH